MPVPSIDRVALLEEALELERMGSQWTVRHVAAVLNCAISTVYNTPWILRLCKRVGKRGRRWIPADVRSGGQLPVVNARRRTGS